MSHVSTGQALDPRTFPRQSVQSGWWRWENRFNAPWDIAEHINTLEVRAIYLSLLWKTLNREFTDRRLFHLSLSDSYNPLKGKNRKPQIALYHQESQRMASLWAWHTLFSTCGLP